MTVGADGHPAAVRAVRSSGYARLDRAAREAVDRWRFEPARKAGLPVAGRLDVPITFRLDES